MPLIDEGEEYHAMTSTKQYRQSVLEAVAAQSNASQKQPPTVHKAQPSTPLITKAKVSQNGNFTIHHKQQSLQPRKNFIVGDTSNQAMITREHSESALPSTDRQIVGGSGIEQVQQLSSQPRKQQPTVIVNNHASERLCYNQPVIVAGRQQQQQQSSSLISSPTVVRPSHVLFGQKKQNCSTQMLQYNRQPALQLSHLPQNSQAPQFIIHQPSSSLQTNSSFPASTFTQTGLKKNTPFYFLKQKPPFPVEVQNNGNRTSQNERARASTSNDGVNEYSPRSTASLGHSVWNKQEGGGTHNNSFSLIPHNVSATVFHSAQMVVQEGGGSIIAMEPQKEGNNTFNANYQPQNIQLKRMNEKESSAVQHQPKQRIRHDKPNYPHCSSFNNKIKEEQNIVHQSFEETAFKNKGCNNESTLSSSFLEDAKLSQYLCKDSLKRRASTGKFRNNLEQSPRKCFKHNNSEFIAAAEVGGSKQLLTCDIQHVQNGKEAKSKFDNFDPSQVLSNTETQQNAATDSFQIQSHFNRNPETQQNKCTLQEECINFSTNSGSQIQTNVPSTTFAPSDGKESLIIEEQPPNNETQKEIEQILNNNLLQQHMKEIYNFDKVKQNASYQDQFYPVINQHSFFAPQFISSPVNNSVYDSPSHPHQPALPSFEEPAQFSTGLHNQASSPTFELANRATQRVENQQPVCEVAIYSRKVDDYSSPFIPFGNTGSDEDQAKAAASTYYWNPQKFEESEIMSLPHYSFHQPTFGFPQTNDFTFLQPEDARGL